MPRLSRVSRRDHAQHEHRTPPSSSTRVQLQPTPSTRSLPTKPATPPPPRALWSSRLPCRKINATETLRVKPSPVPQARHNPSTTATDLRHSFKIPLPVAGFVFVAQHAARQILLPWLAMSDGCAIVFVRG